MWLKKIFVCVMAMLLTCATAFAQEITDEEITHRALQLKDEITWGPNCKGSLNMVYPFQPIQMDSSALKEQGASFYASIGIEPDLIDDIMQIGGNGMSFEDNDGRRITLIFMGYDNDHCFVFEENEQGVEYLIDVVYGSYAGLYSADLVELEGGRYLLTNVYGHGSGSMRNWTSWYNLETRQVEFYTLREGYESYYPVTVKVVTKTNVDHSLTRNGRDAETSELITYTYTTVYTSFNESRNEFETVLDDDCTVRVYRSYEGGLVLVGERVFDSYTPAVLEQMSSDELLNSEWQLIQAGEEMFNTDALHDERSTGGMELVHRIAEGLPVARVANTAWVNVRMEGRKDSAAIASVNAGESVYVISENNGFENGWTYVLVMNEGQEPIIGYIWHSFLEPVQ